MVKEKSLTQLNFNIVKLKFTLIILLVFSFQVLSQNNTDNRLELAKELIENDTKSTNLFMKDLSTWSANFYKYIQSEYLRNKYKKELNNEIKNKLQQLYNTKMNNVKEVEELFGKDALNIIEGFYIDWYNNQLKSIEIFNEFALIFDYCEFQYNPNSKSEMFVFYSDKCLENYNIKIKEMYEIVNNDESLRSKFKSEFVQAVNLGNKIEPEINAEQLSNTDEQDLISTYIFIQNMTDSNEDVFYCYDDLKSFLDSQFFKVWDYQNNIFYDKDETKKYYQLKNNSSINDLNKLMFDKFFLHFNCNFERLTEVQKNIQSKLDELDIALKSKDKKKIDKAALETNKIVRLRNSQLKTSQNFARKAIDIFNSNEEFNNSKECKEAYELIQKGYEYVKDISELKLLKM
tara:strand:+ start:373 stop:1581 length:1209 start_codon:yes stop_codon:yes gene_type:complete